MRMASRWLGWAYVCSCTLACSAQRVVTTWWTDPTSGLMWTGSVASENKRGVNYQQADDLCHNLTLGGYTGWHLPTWKQIHVISKPITYNVSEKLATSGKRAGEIISITPYEVSGLSLRFGPDSTLMLWASDPAGEGEALVHQGAGNSLAAVLKTKAYAPNGPIEAYCVRSMEPDLQSLAEQATPMTPVSSLSQLQSIAVLVQVEKSMASDQFQQSLDLLKNAFALDPKSARGYDDMGMSEAYLGNWQDAITSLNTAHGLNKADWQIIADLKWAKRNQKQADRDPKTTQGRVTVHDADVALQQKHYEDALALANQVIAMEPKWPQGYDSEGDALSGLKRLPDAKSALKKAVALDKHGETNAKAKLKAVKAAIKAGHDL